LFVFSEIYIVNVLIEIKVLVYGSGGTIFDTSFLIFTNSLFKEISFSLK